MINELYELSEAMRECGIHETVYAPNYSAVSYKNCVCISLMEGSICEISSITNAQKAIIRNYASTSNGGFPCVKLAPLYRITAKDVIQLIAACKRKPENLNDTVISKLESVCTESNNNWIADAAQKYQRAFSFAHTINARMKDDPCEAFRILVDEIDQFNDPDRLHKELSRVGIEMLRARENVSLMLDLLFNCTDPDNHSDSSGEISILFNAEKLYSMGMPVTSARFTDELNRKLLSAESHQNSIDALTSPLDAFGVPFRQNDDVMPNIKIGAGFYVKIRTMNKDIPCLHRYGKEGSATFPASCDVRRNLQMALNYISKRENKDKTWMCIDTIDGKPHDILFAYPLNVTQTPDHFASAFRRPQNSSISFTEKAKKFILQLKTPRNPSKDSYAKDIRIFVLRRLNVKNNSGRTKVVYTRQTDPDELERSSEAWTLGCTNLPQFPFGAPEVPYPLDIADTLNCPWKQDGTLASTKFKPVPQYHGMELLLEPTMSVRSDLHMLTENAVPASACWGKLITEKDLHHPVWDNVKKILALLGLFLYRNGIRKEDYMDNLPYLYGQLLKAADALHAQYCKVVRKGDIPPQLVGGGLFLSAAEAPVRTLNVLSQRIMPYYQWAKSYRLKDEPESRLVGWLYQTCEKIAMKIGQNWTIQTRLNEEEKAQMFIGYLAAFPQKEKDAKKSEEDTVYEQ